MSRGSKPSPPLKIFVSHGHDVTATTELLSWLSDRKSLSIEPVEFGRSAIIGDTITETFEREASVADAAIILATPDDIGRLADGERGYALRARQNVWIELGWFWGRLGRRRTLLLTKGAVEVPTNWHGLNHLAYERNVAEITADLKNYLRSLRSLPPDVLTEILYLSSDPNTREKEFAEVHESARERLIILGISMKFVRQLLPRTLTMMRESKRQLSLQFVVVHPNYTRENFELFEEQHRQHSVKDNHSFFGYLLDTLRRYQDVCDQVEIKLYSGFPTFAAVVADGGNWGSTMIGHSFLPNIREKSLDYPRLKLKNRSLNGVYRTYWSAINEFIAKSSETIRGLEQLEALVAEVNAY